MERESISSSMIRSIGYDPSTSTLEIEFNKGGVYQYQGFSQADYDALMNAGSKGRHFLANIKNQFSATKQ